MIVSSTDVRAQLAMTRWGMCSPDEVVGWATTKVAEGFDQEFLIEVAMLRSPSRSEVTSGLSRLLLETRVAVPSASDLADLAISQLVRRIASREVDPVVGARRIRQITLDLPSVNDNVMQFIGMLSEWEDDNEHRDEYASAVLQAARVYVHPPL